MTVTALAGDSEVCVTYFLLVVDVGGRFGAQILHQAANNGVSSVLHLKGSRNREQHYLTMEKPNGTETRE